MFCPNCGTENSETANACTKCGFKLKAAAAPKFKGTMLMMNAPPPQAPQNVPPAQGPTPAPPATGAAVNAPAAPRPNLKGTMLGVAPPASGAQAPPTHQAAATPPPPTAAAAPPAPAPARQPAEAGFGAPQAPQYPGGVNPLGGTMVAGPAGMNPGGTPQWGAQPAGQAPGWGAPAPTAPGDQAVGGHPQQGYGAPPGVPGYGGPPGQDAHGGYGAPPGGHPGYGIPQGGPPGYGPGGPGYSGGTPGYGGAPGYGAQPMAGAPHPGAMAPYGGQAMAPYGGQGMQHGAGPRGAVGKERNPVMVVVLGYVTCGIYFFLAGWSMLNELRAFRGKDDVKLLFFLLPILQWIELWKLPEKVLDAKHMAGIANPQVASPILYLLFWPYFFTVDLNEVWQAASPPRQIGA